MSVLAAIRPDDWNLPLFLHVLGAFTLVGALVTAASFLVAARRDGSLASVRLGYRALLYAALPAVLVMRLAAQWIYDKEGIGDAESDPAWIEVGFISTDPGLLLLIAATVMTGLSVRRAGRGEGDPRRGVAIAAGIVAAQVVLYLVVIWVMATKPA
jgi:hypothetical protein